MGRAYVYACVRVCTCTRTHTCTQISTFVPRPPSHLLASKGQRPPPPRRTTPPPGPSPSPPSPPAIAAATRCCYPCAQGPQLFFSCALPKPSFDWHPKVSGLLHSRQKALFRCGVESQYLTRPLAVISNNRDTGMSRAHRYALEALCFFRVPRLRLAAMPSTLQDIPPPATPATTSACSGSARHPPPQRVRWCSCSGCLARAPGLFGGHPLIHRLNPPPPEGVDNNHQVTQGRRHRGTSLAFFLMFATNSPTHLKSTPPLPGGGL